MFNYVCKLSDNKIIKMYGYCDFTGQFDGAIYRQVSCNGEKDLPSGWHLEVSKPIQQRLIDYISTKDLSEQKKLISLIPTVNICLYNNLIPLAESIIGDADIKQQTKNEILSMLG